MTSRIDSWVGVPYELGGASRLGADCWGLVKAIFLARGADLPAYNQELAGKRVPPKGYVQERIREEGARAWVTIPRDRVEPGDVVVLRSLRPSDHIAIVSEDPAWLLTTDRASGAHLVRWEEWHGRIEGIYRFAGA